MAVKLESTTFKSMGYLRNAHERNAIFFFASLLYSIQLVYGRENFVGAKFYIDPSNAYIVK